MIREAAVNTNSHTPNPPFRYAAPAPAIIIALKFLRLGSGIRDEAITYKEAMTSGGKALGIRPNYLLWRISPVSLFRLIARYTPGRSDKTCKTD
jgi:hypothetical protein